MVGDLVFLWTVYGKVILSLVVHRIRHDVPGVLANDCAFGDPYDCAESYSGVVWGGELRNVFF